MDFPTLKQHLIDNACSLDQLAENVYMARNCINGNHCIIEDLGFYNIGTLAHYIYQLNIDVPEEVEDFIQVYTNWREHVKNVGFVPIDKEEK